MTRRVVLLTPLVGAELERLLRALGQGVQPAVIRDRDGLEPALSGGDVTLIGFGTGVIVPATMLGRLDGPAYNVHAASPDFPGRDPHHHAVYRGAKVYGATLHEMSVKVDAGRIVGIESFPVPPGTTPRQLLALASEAAMRLLERFGARLLEPEPLPTVEGVAWGETRTSRSDLLRLSRLSPDITAEELERRLKAFDDPDYDNIRLGLHGRTFRLDRHEA